MIIVIQFEIISGEKNLQSFLSPYRRVDSLMLKTDFEDILAKLTEDGRETWFAVTYKGTFSNLLNELSYIRIDRYQKHLIHATVPGKNLSELQRVTDVLDHSPKFDNSDAIWQLASSPKLASDELELLIVVPEYEFGWQFRKVIGETPDFLKH